MLSLIRTEAPERTDGGDDVGRRWRLNPPPNWPVLPDGWEPAPDWSPDPAWGPAPVGWTLWRRERRSAWLRRHRRSAGIGSAAVLTLFVTLAGPPSSGTFSDAEPGAVALGAPPPAGGTMIAAGTPPDRPRADPPVRLDRRTPPASRERRPVSRSRARVVAAPVPTETRERVPNRPRHPNRTPNRTPNGGGGSPTCPSSPAPTPTTTPEVFGRPTATPGVAPASTGTCSPGGGTPGPTGSSSPEPSG